MNFQQEEWIKCAKSPIYYLNTYGHVFNAEKQAITKMTCFPYQETCLKKFKKFQNNIVLKSRQCLPEDTCVDTPNGPKNIQDLKVGDKVCSYNLDLKKYEIDTICDSWYSGERQCVKFKLQDTRNFEVGENHPFYVKSKGWIKAKDLKKGDEILDIDLDFGKINVDEDYIKILAYLITDGCTNKQVKFTNNNINYLNEFEECIKNKFPDLEIRKSSKLKGFDYFPHQKHGSSSLNSLMEWCQKNGIANKKTEFKNLSDEVFEWDKESLSLLVNRIFAGDGWISILKKIKNKRLELGLGSPSKKFLEQIKFILKKFNIKSNIYEVKKMKLQKNKFFKLRITHSKSIIKFVNEIGIYDKIKKEHIEICENYKHNVKNSSIIKKIEKTQVKKCYDISVKNNENFLINGLLTHNTGLSVVTAGYVAWTIIFRHDQKVLIIANDGVGAIRFLETVKKFVELTPIWLLPDSIVTKNTKKIVLSNGSYAEAKASSPNAGRGDSLTLLVLDETAFIKDADDIWMAAGMALSMTQGKCIMISTPHGSGNLYYRTWIDSQEKGDKAPFVPTKVHWTENPVCSKELEERETTMGEKYFWSPWYEKECARLHNDTVKIAQELDLSFEGSQRYAIENELIRKYEQRLNTEEYKNIILNRCYFDTRNKPGEQFVKYETPFHIFKLPIEGHKYILSSDVGRGDDFDFSTIQILDLDTLEVVAEYKEKIPPDILAHIINQIGRIYNYAYVVVEANSFGLGTAIDLNRKMDYKKMHFCKSFAEIFVRPYDYKIEENQDIPGFQTTKKTRPLVVNSLRTYMREGELKIYGVRTISEFRNFVQKGERPEAERGYNDDLIFGLAIGLFVRDTDFKNAAASEQMYRNMIDSIGFSSYSLNGRIDSSGEEEKQNKEIKEDPNNDAMIISSSSGLPYNNVDDNPDDISWLYG